MGVNLCCCKLSNIDGPAGLQLRVEPTGPVYPQTSPPVNRLGLNPAVSSSLRLSLPPSLRLLACLFASAPRLYSGDRRTDWEEEEEEKESGCVRKRE